MIYLTSKLNGNALSLDLDGCLMETYCAGGVMYTNPKYVDWDNLDATTYVYYEGRHRYLLSETMPDRLEDFYPTPVSA